MRSRVRTGMAKGAFPFRYLGGPITASRISERDCDVLVDKLTKQITSWTTKNLSYAGRAKLINTVLYGIISFWSRIFLIPNKVMKKIMALCRNYLWSSSPEYKKCPLINWEEVCLPKQEGGLGLKNLLKWNQASIMRLIWDIASKKDTLWVKWIHTKYLKGATVWEYSPKQDDCYYWKKMLQNRKLFQGMTTMTSYDSKIGYDWLIGMHTRVDWRDLVWNKWSIPKHKFIAWLIWKGIILTKDRLSRFMDIDTKCVLCEEEVESADHLFCTCSFVVSVHKALRPWLKHDLVSTSLTELKEKMWKGKNRKDRLWIASSIVSCCYYVWKARNSKLHNKREETSAKVAEEVKTVLAMAVNRRD
ncbi:unnamed protein product [Cuscuta campestris]|uniref:Reverse transcriptase zinc-binding domain-containing protein n=1 Tax=Cuscuta campestris TaxID=132261 RepID=A0A484MC96_9ASTE|nr:unnamed protein product [Cuscuta campestris]